MFKSDIERGQRCVAAAGDGRMMGARDAAALPLPAGERARVSVDASCCTGYATLRNISMARRRPPASAMLLAFDARRSTGCGGGFPCGKFRGFPIADALSRRAFPIRSRVEIPKQRHLLISEDDPRARELMTAAAERTGKFAAVTTVEDGRAALDFILAAAERRARLPDFVLTDLSMPRLDGIELIRELKRREATRDIPIALMTSSDRPNDREDATTAGCCAFFNKPLRFDDMITLIASLPNICGDDAITTGERAPSRPL